MADTFLHVDAAALRAHVANLIAAYPELADDAELRLDTIEGETDFMSIIRRALAARQDADTMVSAISARIADLIARKSRFERQGDAMKRLMRVLMQDANQDKITLPDATLSLTKPRNSVDVLDAAELPQGFFKSIRQADKAAIKSALESGEKVPGAQLVTGEIGLTIRTK